MRKATRTTGLSRFLERLSIGRLPERSAWWGMAGLVATVFLFMFSVGFLYRLFRPTNEFWGFSANIASLVSLIALLGLQLEQGRELLRAVSWRWAATGWLLVAVAAAVFVLGPRPVAYRHNRLGSEALGRGDLTTALHHYEIAAGLDPRNARAHHNLGRAYQQLQDSEKAMTEYERALALDDQLAEAYNGLGEVYLSARNEPDAALTLFLTGIAWADREPTASVLAMNAGWAYLEKRLPRAALEYLAKGESSLLALQNSGDNVVLYLAETNQLMAAAYEQLGDAEETTIRLSNARKWARYLLDSAACAEPRNQAAVDCVSLQVLAAEVEERLGKQTGGQ